jgi:hypothetical protein
MKQYFIIISFAIILNNCTGDGISDSVNFYFTYFPLTVGNTWYFNDTGSASNEPDLKRVIKNSIEINGKIYYTVEDTYGYDSPWPASNIDTVYKDSQGRIFRYSGNGDYLLYDFSAIDGSSYIYKDYVVTVKKVGLVETPAGNFNNCIEILFDIPVSIDDETWYTFAPYVGLVLKRMGEGPGYILDSYEF